MPAVPSLLVVSVLATATPVVNHDLAVRLDVPAHRIDVTDTITLGEPRDMIELVLHAGMSPTMEGRIAGAKVEVSPLPPGGAVAAERVRVLLPAPTKTLVLRYGGSIVHPPAQVATEHQRSFQETPGTIDVRGVYLGAEARWFPRIMSDATGRSNELFTSKIKVTGLPAGWRALSEGDAAGDNAWVMTTPCDDLHLVAGPFAETKARKEGVDVLVWLRTDSTPPDGNQALAQRYLDVTGQYLALYKELIGPYPYGKFALVENFWETGYGMASFTLLGPQVIRFPFILHTSWPHELLHNWWGNGVFVEGGNWSEGLTAYLADHLTAEREGRGDEYRRTTLQKYQDFVGPDPSLDFPLAQFGSRFSAASEAVGYGKWLMVVHMLRQKLGDDAFKAGLQKLWKEHRFDRASFNDVRAAFQAQTTEDLAPFFAAWVERTGAPRIRWKEARSGKDPNGRHFLDVTLQQRQAGAPFPLDVPIVITLVDGRSVASRVPFDGKSAAGSARVSLPGEAARVDVDPFVDTFRQLLKGETPPSLSRALGARKALFVLPTLASADERAGWARFARGICGGEVECTFLDDKKVDSLPRDAAVWILGYGNELRASAVATASAFGARLDDRGFLSPGPWSVERLKAERADPAKTSIVVAGSNPRNDEYGLAFVGAHTPKAIDLLARKIPHYGKYGYLGFIGDAAENSLKGIWPAVSSPNTLFVGAGLRTRPALAAKSGPALARLPPPFDPERMLALVNKLAAMNGRGNGTRDLDDALAVVQSELKGAGLGVARACASPATPTLCNVVATIPGKDPSQSRVVLGAHVDHLGKLKGKVHPGADDNASGVAVLVETARALAKAGPFQRTIEVVAFSGEEDGLKGSRAYVAALGPDAKTKVHSMVNLDTVGRRGTKSLLVLDGNSASEWVHIFRGVGFTTGVASELTKEGGGASDQVAFLEAGIPAVQLFGGPHPDYHRPTDTADKIDGARLVDAVVVTRETLAYLADRKEPLTAAGAAPSAAGTGGPRRASLGTVPDMTFMGAGVAIDDVVGGSPAAAVGLKKGDVLVRFDGKPVADLRSYSELLKSKQPGDKVSVTVVRDGKELSFDVTLAER